MAYELHSQIFPTLILNLVTTLEKSFDSCYARDPSGGKLEDSKPMIDHFHWNEFERNTYPSNT